ncbi:hypothetical protein HOP62_12645 [Halomonas sp. MCCC 1A17488]|uniref:DUF6746 family protein n=1 Tax=unclassified Halomonas TaxID=2609666 RepID=UPI0018D215CD|nr:MULTISPECIES: DUF6746 family protein [unclassified Halomonas]MCE8016918.1 hypothetical protein [Halomonas sp. MCCC 1A17488]MCG3240251.1 hypothetical protein [Halomonas sp. MCCC 1A17488]QPP49872.1 hypothetical protein I4484_01705 [Halomonas sp. SS10-MC5]
MPRSVLLPVFALLTLGIPHAGAQDTGVDPADDRVEAELRQELEQTQGQPIETLKQAVDALELRNDLLDVLMAKETLTDGDLAILQQLTEDIENALAKVEEEVGTMRERVREVRASADSQGQEGLRESGREYLDRVRTLMQ